MEKKKFFIVRAYEWLDDKLQDLPGEYFEWVVRAYVLLLVGGFLALCVYGIATGRVSLPSSEALWDGAKMVGAGCAFLAVVSFFQYVCRSALLGLVLFFAVCALINHW
ncbi:hypothetical protein [uncultured Fibrobacter sp.]|uniref:hypothetical protein n=1 Tax=uncultured Fibrobacter sp. TaxID=261512 RepID=UPI0025ECE813|nr:hypothetical protein [uncultured Fibrobacter sp.]